MLLMLLASIVHSAPIRMYCRHTCQTPTNSELATPNIASEASRLQSARHIDPPTTTPNQLLGRRDISASRLACLNELDTNYKLCLGPSLGSALPGVETLGRCSYLLEQMRMICI